MSRPDCAGRVLPGPGGTRECCGYRDDGEGAPCYSLAEPFRPPRPPVDVEVPHPLLIRAARYFDAVRLALDAGATVDQAIDAAREAVRD